MNAAGTYLGGAPALDHLSMAGERGVLLPRAAGGRAGKGARAAAGWLVAARLEWGARGWLPLEYGG